MRKIDPTSDWRYVYGMLEDLYPTDRRTGKRFFCLDDLISEDPEVQKRASSKLITKAYNSHSGAQAPTKLSSAKQKDTCTTHIEKNSKQEITSITIKDGNNNIIHIKAPIRQNAEPETPLKIADFVETGMIVPNRFKFISHSYLIKKGEKTYAYGQNTTRPYLDLKRIGDSHSASNSSDGYSLNLRGLTLLLLSEEDPEKITCILKNLAKTENDIEEHDSKGLVYTVKENYPFLSNYFEQFLEMTGTFVFYSLKEIAIEIKDTLDKIPSGEPKYIVTRKFYFKIESLRWGGPRGIRRSALTTLGRGMLVPKEVSLYRLNILYYLRSHIAGELTLIDALINDNNDNLAYHTITKVAQTIKDKMQEAKQRGAR